MTDTIRSMTMVDQDELTASDLAAVANDAGQIGGPTLMACYHVEWERDGNTMDPDLQVVVIHPEGASRSRIGIALNADAQWGDLEHYVGGSDSLGFDAAVYQAIYDYLNDADAWGARN